MQTELISCPYCGRQFATKGYLAVHNNSKISCVTKLKDREIHKQQIAERRLNPKQQPQAYYYKRWYEKNKEAILQKKHDWYKKPENVEKCHNWYLNYKDRINAITKDVITCDICNSSIVRNNLARHKKSKKCLNYNKT